MKTIKRSTCALTGRAIRLCVDRDGAYAVIVAGEHIGCGYDASRAELVYSSVAHTAPRVRGAAAAAQVSP